MHINEAITALRPILLAMPLEQAKAKALDTLDVVLPFSAARALVVAALDIDGLLRAFCVVVNQAAVRQGGAAAMAAAIEQEWGL